MVTVTALCDPEGGLLDEADRRLTPAGQPIPAEWDLPTWEDIVRVHSARVYRLAYRLTGNPHDAEDLTQEVFVRVFRSLSSYTPGTFEGWLHRITTNLFLDSARRKQRIHFEGLADEMAHRLPGSEPTPAQAFDDSHLDDDVQAALKALPPNTGRRSCCATSRASPMRRSPLPSASSWARYAAGFTAAGLSCAPPWSTAGPRRQAWIRPPRRTHS